MKIAMIGSGYVGLVASACFADFGHRVACVDIDAERVDTLRSGGVPFYEPGLQELVARTSSEGHLSFTTDIAAACSDAQVVFIAVGTPQSESGEADLRPTLAAAGAIAENLRGETVIVTKSTVPVGTHNVLRAHIAARTNQKFHIASNPEFLKEGTALSDFLKPDRIVIGVDSHHAEALLTELYEPLVRTGRPVLVMDLASAELSKYAANAMLALRIAFMNDIANLCDKVGADVEWVRRCLASDTRIGPAFLFPGIGYGGSCFPKDVQALVATARENGLDFAMLANADASNTKQKERLVSHVVEHFGEDLRGKRIAIWGLAFKPNTDDMREAPSLAVIRGLTARGAHVIAFDPVAGEVARRLPALTASTIEFVSSAEAAIDGADALLVCTEWNEFRLPDFARIKQRMKTPVVFDGRNIYSPERMRKLGFTYRGIGRPTDAS